MYPNTLTLNNGVRIPQLGATSLPKTANPSHMETNAQVEFAISATTVMMLRVLTSMASSFQFSPKRTSSL